MERTIKKLEEAAYLSLKPVADENPTLDYAALANLLDGASETLLHMENLAMEPALEARKHGYWRAESRLVRARREQQELPLCEGHDKCCRNPTPRDIRYYSKRSLCHLCAAAYTRFRDDGDEP